MFVDANIFLEILLEDARDRSCEIFLLQCLEKKQPLFTSDFIVYACLLAIESRLPDAPIKMKDFLISLHSLHVTILRPSLMAMEKAFASQPTVHAPPLWFGCVPALRP